MCSSFYQFREEDVSSQTGQAAGRCVEAYIISRRSEIEALLPVYKEVLAFFAADDCSSDEFQYSLHKLSKTCDNVFKWDYENSRQNFNNDADYVKDWFKAVLAIYSELLEKVARCGCISTKTHFKKEYDELSLICAELPTKLILNENEHEYFDDDMAWIEQEFRKII